MRSSLSFCRRISEIRIDNLLEMIKAPIVGSIAIAIIALLVRSFINSNALICVITIILSVIIYSFILILMKNEFALSFLKPFIDKVKGRNK